MPVTVLLRAAAVCAALVWLNVYVCREAFWLNWSGRMNSMHGLWITLAAKGGGHWLWPSWWPYWFGGMPMENTYAPGVPVLMSWIAAVFRCPVSQAFHAVAALTYVLGPVALFLLLWRLSGGRLWAGFCAAACYSVYTPLVHRFYLAFVWDEVPHLLALALVCLGVTALHERFTLLATLLFACAFLTNAFALTGAAVMAGSWTIATGGWRAAAGVLLPAYLLASPWLPPSLLATMQTNAAAMPERAVPAGLGASIVLAGLAAWRSRARLSGGARCLLLSGVVFASVPWLQSLPQPDRYRIEADAVIVSAAGLALFGAASRRWLRVALAIALLWPASQQLIALRRFAKRELRPVAIEGSIEARVARWLEAHPDDGLVLAPGSIGQWMNVFTNVRQFGGGSYPTAVNRPQQTVLIWCNSIETGEVKRWLQAYGVTRFVVPGPKSPEFWKPVRDPSRFEGAFRLLWREDDTSIYEIPRAHAGPVPVNYHHGWRATVDGARRRVVRNDYGTISLDPECAAPCHAEFYFDSGWEAKATRAAAAAAAFYMLANAIRARRTARLARSSC